MYRYRIKTLTFSATAQQSSNVLWHWAGQRWQQWLSHWHDPVCRGCGNALASGSLSKRLCVSCLSLYGWSPTTPISENPSLQTLCQLTPPLKALLYKHKFYAHQADWFQCHQSLLHLWAHAPNVFPPNPQGVVGITTLPHRFLADTPPTQQTHRPLDRLLKDACTQWQAAGFACQWISPSLLAWQKETLPQHHMHKRASRLANMHQAFYVHPDIWMQLKAKHRWSYLLVLDDLLTTGTSLNSAQQALQATGLPCWGMAMAHVPLSL